MSASELLPPAGSEVFTRHIPPADVRVGDYFDAKVPCQSKRYGGKRDWIRTCELVSICEPILQVTTKTRSGLVAIKRDQIVGTAWGYRPQNDKTQAPT